MRLLFYIVYLVILDVTLLLSHPTGNMIVVGENVIWSYVHPIDDPQHHAVIMIWKEGKKPIPWITSMYSSSDFMLYNEGEQIFIIERRYIQESDHHEIRILKTKLGAGIEEIWPWFVDEYRIGEAGFVMTSDTSILFASYPDLLLLRKGEKPIPFFKFKEPIKRLRGVAENQLLLLSDRDCFLTDYSGKELKRWKKLIRKKVRQPPLERNQIFDMDYHNGSLLIAYWGNRSFELFNSRGKRKVLIQEDDPFTPHWVAFKDGNQLLFASNLVFNGSNPRPKLVLMKDNENIQPIWVP